MNGENEVAYYIYAENDANKTESHPRMGADDPHLFSYSGGSIGLDEVTENEFLRIYPNPNSGQFRVKTNLSSGTINILNLTGQIVYSDTLKNQDTTMIDVSGFVPGIYILRIKSVNSIVTKKLLIE